MRRSDAADIRSPDEANGSRECALDDRLRAIRDKSLRGEMVPRISLRSIRATKNARVPGVARRAMPGVV